MAGGSEFRCIEFANGLIRFTTNETFVLAERKMPDRLRKHLDPRAVVIEDVFGSPKYFYDLDAMFVINTDAKEFSTKDYWTGKSPRHNLSIDLERMKNKKMFFLYNFIVSPSRHLSELVDEGWDINIVTTNSSFYSEITKQDRYESIRILPRYILESPINPDLLEVRERIIDVEKPIVFGMHSKRVGNKWNDEFPKLIEKMNDRYGAEKVKFRFMGIKSELSVKLTSFENVCCMKEDAESVKDFLNSLDVFLFFPDWGREEPWARVIAEGMVSGCPVIALDKGGTRDQVMHAHNGFLCKKIDDYYNHMVYMVEHPEMISKMSKNSLRLSKYFYTCDIIERMMRMIDQ
jgi:glycosyltransferase involved in cell wall biosynthesis